MRAPPARHGTGPIGYIPTQAPVATVAKRQTSAAAIDTFVAPTTKPAPAARPILLFNDQCAVCRTISAWVKRQDDGGKDLIDERPIGNDPEALLAIHPGLDIWEVYSDIHVVMPDGALKRGGEAVAEVLKRLPSQRWYAWALDVQVAGRRPFQGVLNAAYKLLNEIRPAIGCESCGGGPVVWWAKPIRWTADAVRWVKGKLGD